MHNTRNIPVIPTDKETWKIIKELQGKTNSASTVKQIQSSGNKTRAKFPRNF